MPKPKLLWFCKNNIGDHFQDLWIRKDSLNRLQEPLTRNEKMDKFDYIEIKNLIKKSLLRELKNELRNWNIYLQHNILHI